MISDPYHPALIPLTNPVFPSDRVTATVSESGATYWMTLNDQVQNWSWSTSITGGAASGNWAAVAAESYFGGAYFDPVAVTGAQVNGLPLGLFNPEADEQGPNIFSGMAGLDPSGLDASGQNFSFSWNGQPGLAFTCCYGILRSAAVLAAERRESSQP